MKAAKATPKSRINLNLQQLFIESCSCSYLKFVPSETFFYLSFNIN